MKSKATAACNLNFFVCVKEKEIIFTSPEWILLLHTPIHIHGVVQLKVLLPVNKTARAIAFRTIFVCEPHEVAFFARIISKS